MVVAGNVRTMPTGGGRKPGAITLSAAAIECAELNGDGETVERVRDLASRFDAEKRRRARLRRNPEAVMSEIVRLRAEADALERDILGKS